jgi:hypothetical protein
MVVATLLVAPAGEIEFSRTPFSILKGTVSREFLMFLGFEK